MSASVDRYGVQPLSDEIEELKRKIALLDGDQKAFVENARVVKRQNHEKIREMREENKRARARLASLLVGDEKVVTSAFSETSRKQPPSFRDVKSEVAIERFDQRACELEKMLNALKHDTLQKQKKFAQLKTQIAQNECDFETTRTNNEGQSPMAQALRQLENRLDKATIKYQEAMHIQKTYRQIIDRMQEERLHYDKQLETLTKAIQEKKRTYRDLASVANDADLARDTAKAELSREETQMVQRRRQNEQTLSTYKKMAEDKKEGTEKVEKRSLHRQALPDDDSIAHESSTSPVEIAGHEKLEMYEAHLTKIKEATGVTDEQEIMERFMSQDKTTEHLEKLKEINQRQLEDLRKDKTDLLKQFEDLKYSGEAKISSGQKMLEEFKEHLDDAKTRMTDTQLNADRTTKLLLDVNAGIVHLQEKLHHLKAPKPSIPVQHPPPDAEDYMLDVLATVEQKLVRLVEEMDGRDIDQLMNEMEDMQFRSTIEGKLPDYNTRITLPEVSFGDEKQFEDDEESESDDDMLTRQALKRHSQQLVDAKTKKKRRRRAKDD